MDFLIECVYIERNLLNVNSFRVMTVKKILFSFKLLSECVSKSTVRKILAWFM